MVSNVLVAQSASGIPYPARGRGFESWSRRFYFFYRILELSEVFFRFPTNPQVSSKNELAHRIQHIWMYYVPKNLRGAPTGSYSSYDRNVKQLRRPLTLTLITC